jgi:DNA repair photolyase
MERADNPACVSRQDKGDWVTKVKYENIVKLFSGLSKGKQSKSIYDIFIKNRKMVQWGGLTDPFDEIEAKEGESLKLVKFFKEINYPIRICTKGARTLMKPEYIEVFKGSKNFVIMWTIITDDDEIAKNIEVGAPTPTERFQAMKIYHEMGIPQIIRIRPFLQGITSKSWKNLIEKAHECGAEAISVEWLCIQRMAGVKVRERYKELSKILGYDIFEYYRKLSTGANSYMRLNPKMKESYVLGMKELCHKLGMRFAISDPHFKHLNDNLSCCGLAESCNFTISPFNLALKIAREKGVVYWKDIEKSVDWAKEFSASTIWQSRGEMQRRKRKIQNGKDYVRTLWNVTKKQSSCPFLYFAGYLMPIGNDEDGNIIYKADDNFQNL